MKKLIHIFVILFISSVFAQGVFAQSKPTSEAARAFLDFYYKGQGQGVILADMTVCTTVEENECSDTLSLTSLKKGTRYLLWMAYVVPKDDEVEGILIQFNQGGITRFTREASVKGSFRYRMWKAFTPNRAGEWEVKVLHDRGEQVETLKALTFTVVDEQ